MDIDPTPQPGNTETDADIQPLLHNHYPGSVPGLSNRGAPDTTRKSYTPNTKVTTPQPSRKK